MSELETSHNAGGAVTGAAGVLETVVTYAIVIPQLIAAGVKLRGLSEEIRGTYRYIERCSVGVDRLAEQMASIEFDTSSVGEHRDAAAVMRGVLADAEAMAAALEDLSSLFHAAALAHQADYGPVTETVHAMPVSMAKAEAYSNR